LGKKIEDVLLKYLIRLMKQGGYMKITSKYTPTPKNRQTSGFYEKNGFILDETTVDGAKKYFCTIDNIDVNISDIYLINKKIT